MSIQIYMDHNISRAITDGLKTRGVKVITAFEDGRDKVDDNTLLDRAVELGCVLFTMDYDLLQEASKRQKKDITFHGVIYAHQLRISIGDCILDLEIIAKAGNGEDLMNSVIFLPLK